MSLLAQEAALRSLAKEKKGMARRMKQFGIKPAQEDPEVSEYDMQSYSRAVRLEIDVCVPLPELKKMLLDVRNDVTNALAWLERDATPNDKRHAVHNLLARAKTAIFIRRREIEMAKARKPPLP